MIKSGFSAFILLLVSCTLLSQKQEMRGVWITTVFNRDWPQSKTLTPQAQRAAYTKMLDEVLAMGFNSVFVQIRCSADAFYPSDLEPWSEWLTGTQGKAPEPFYDPLAFLIEEAQKRGLEFHAWINPFRAVTNNTTSSVSSTHISNRRPDWMMTYSTYKVINPGIPDAREYVKKVVMDITRRYPIDGIHFDDYFYPYPVTGQTLSDESTFVLHNRGITNINDWRRDNINLFVKEMRDSIKKFDKRIKFGISPFGIWKNTSSDSQGSATNGLESFSAIYADTRKWMNEGWVDYVAPQLYWPFGFTAARYEVLVPWWQNQTFSNHIYIGQGAYRMDPTATNSWSIQELPSQLRYNRNTSKIRGSLFYSTLNLTSNHKNIRDSLTTAIYNLPALRPNMPWLDNVAPLSPTNLLLSKSNNNINLKWVRSAQAADGEYARQYIIYRFEKGENVDITRQDRIIHITSSDVDAYTDSKALPTQTYTYVLTALDRLHNESPQSNRASSDALSSSFNITNFQKMKAWPNPTNGRLAIKFDTPILKSTSLNVLNLQGQKVSTHQLTTGMDETTLDLSDLPKGTYILQAESILPLRIVIN